MFDNILLPGDPFPENLDSKSDINSNFITLDNQKCSTVFSAIKGEQVSNRRNLFVPALKDTVVCRVVRCSLKSLILSIIAVFKEGTMHELATPMSAEIYDVDMMTNITSDFKVYLHFKPGDLMKGRIISYGRSGFYARISIVGEGLGKYDLSDGSVTSIVTEK